MHLIQLLIIICATSHLLGPVFGRDCYTCKATNTHERDGPCREFVESSTKKGNCKDSDWCKTKIEDKSETGQGIWYQRLCKKQCVNESDTNGEVSFTTSCCKSHLCNGDEAGKNRPSPATTPATTTPAPTTTLPATTVTTTLAADTTVTTPVPATGTGTTSEQTTITTTATSAASTAAVGSTDTSTDTTESTDPATTTARATTKAWEASTMTPPASGQQCYECSSFFLGDSCDTENLETESVDKVFCGGDIGSCGKIVTRLGFDWLGFDLSKSRGCTTLCSGKTEEIESSIFTDIHCCEGDLCNGATPGVSRITFFHVIIIVAAAYWIRF